MAPALAPDAGSGGHLADPDLNRPPRTRLVAIDWEHVAVASEADALALWQQIAPTGEDWDDKLQEIPADKPVARELALALLHGGNFTCAPPAPPAARDCARAPLDVPAPAPTATFADPCLRRLLALWAIDQLEDEDLPRARDALRTIAAIPPPESQLVAAAIKALPETDLAGKLELFELAWKAGQRELVNGSIGAVDVPQLIDAATRLHIDGALDILSAEGHRAVYLGAVTDEQMVTPARIQAMADLAAADALAAGGVDKLSPELIKALALATKSADCAAAAAAARLLDQHGDHRLIPRRPHARTAPAMMRAMCVLASFEQLQRADEASLVPGYLAARGLELVKISYDPYSEVDTDGDGDPHTERTIDLVPRAAAVLPELEDLVRALRHCTGTTCTSDEHEFRFTWKPGPGGELVLWRLEVTERPPCPPTR